MRNSLNYTAALTWPAPLPTASRLATPPLSASRIKRDLARPLVTRRTKACAGEDLPKRRHRTSLGREMIAGCALLALVGVAVFGSDLLSRDSTTVACQQRVVAPENYATDPDTRGERIDRLDWDRDLNAGSTPASRHVPRDPNDCTVP